MLEFATALRQVGGLDADLDLWHTTTHENWSTFGVTAIRDSDFVLIAVSRPYRERWEESGSLSEGAGAAREANAIKSIFEQDRREFRRRVKVILLPGTSVDDIPMELLASAERFRVNSFDLPGLSSLLRTLYGKPELIKPPLGGVPSLPPLYVAGVAAASSPADGEPVELGSTSDAQLLARRLDQIQAELRAGSARSASAMDLYQRQALTRERQILEDTLAALKHVSARSAATGPVVEEPEAPRDELERARVEARAAIAEAQAAMRVIPPVAREALFQYLHAGQPLTVGGILDRCSVEDAIRAEENGYVNWVEDEDQTERPV